jgi:hypothetical protein
MGNCTLVKHLVNSPNQGEVVDPSPNEYFTKASCELEDVYLVNDLVTTNTSQYQSYKSRERQMFIAGSSFST